MTVMVHLLRLARAKGGLVGLEAIFSITLMLVTFMAMWEVATFVFDASKVNSATQMASQSAVAVVDRTAYRTPQAGNESFVAAAQRRAKIVADEIVAANTTGMARGFSHGLPTLSPTTVQVVCGDPPTYSPSTWTAARCGTGAGGAAVLVGLDAHTGLMFPGLGDITFQGRSASFSFAP